MEIVKDQLDIPKLKRKITWKFRGFLVGLAFGIALVASGAYLIHPGLAIMVVASALTFFMHVNAKMLDETLRQLAQAEMILGNIPKDQPKDILKDYNPGGYH